MFLKYCQAAILKQRAAISLRTIVYDYLEGFHPDAAALQYFIVLTVLVSVVVDAMTSVDEWEDSLGKPMPYILHIIYIYIQPLLFKHLNRFATFLSHFLS